MHEETVFTRVVSGDLPSYSVYEDDTTYAFLDIDPHAPGHTLVVPKTPYVRLQDIPKEEVLALFEVLWELITAVERGVDADATTLILNNGEAADQEIPHVHWHIVPRFEDDGTLIEYHPLVDRELTDEEMESLAAAIRDAQ